MARKKKTSGKSVAAISLAAFLALGAISSNDDNSSDKRNDSSRVVQAQQEIIKNSTSTYDPDAPVSSSKKVEEKTESKPNSSTSSSTSQNTSSSENTQTQKKYYGSTESDKYHRSTCRWVKEINEENLIEFNSEEDAVAAGYKPCGVCNP